MGNLHIRQIIEDQQGHIQFHVYGHGQFSDSDLHKLIHKKSLWESAGTKTVYGKTYKIVKIIAADGWEEAE